VSQYFSFILLLIVSFPVAAANDAKTLARLSDLAVKNSPVISTAAGNLQIQELEYRNTFWSFFPSLDLETGYGLARVDAASGSGSVESVTGSSQVSSSETRKTPVRSEFNLTLSQELNGSDGKNSYSGYKLAQAKYERAKLEYEQARDEHLLKVAHAYWEWSSAVEVRDIEETKREMLRRQFTVLNAQYKQGLKTKRDLLRIETEIRRLAIVTLDRNNEVELGVQKLSALIGVGMDQLRSENLLPEKAKAVELAAASTLNVEEHRKSRIFALQNDEAHYATNIVRQDYWPKVSWENSAKWTDQDYVDTGMDWGDNRVLGWQTMLVLRYNIWDWGIRRRQVEVARVKETNVELESRQGRLDLATELREVYLKLNQFRENLSATKDLLTLEQQSYSVLETEYRNGRATYLDLITNLNSLVDARGKFLESYFGYRKQQALYSLHKGTLYVDLKKL
jgi:outer membrane protein